MKIIVAVLFLITTIIASTTPFPTITSKTLTKSTITLPLQNTNQLLILGLDMKSAEPMEQWVRKLNLATTDTIEWYQIPVIGGVPPLVDGIIQKNMKKSVPSIIHNRFLPYFGDTDPIYKALSQTPITDKVTPFLVIIDTNQTISFNIQAVATTENVSKELETIELFK